MNVLIISHNPFNRELPNGRTLYELFSGFEKNELAEIYLHHDEPNFDVCNQYYRITDSDMFKNCISGKKAGKVIDESVKFTAQNNSAYKYGSKHKSYTVLLRNAIWTIGNWFNKDLKKWISDFKPDVLFFYLGNYNFSMNIAIKIAKYFNIPIVTYIVDDYYFNKNLKKGFWGNLNHFLYSNKLKKLLNGRTTICLNDAMKNKYASAFSGDFHTIYTLSSLSAFGKCDIGDTIKMSYLGGIACDRYKSLIQIGEIISDNNLPIDFSVYTRESREWLVEPLKNAKGLCLNDGLCYEDVIKTMENSNILVHTEGFDKESEDLVRYSMSTKIADTLSSNRCLLAYGPKGIASIDYLINNDCAYVATNKDELYEILSLFCNNKDSINQKNSKALDIAEANHSHKSNHKKLLNILNQAIE